MTARAVRPHPTFPRGLLQPPGSYRSGADALLLAACGAAAFSAPRGPAVPGTSAGILAGISAGAPARASAGVSGGPEVSFRFADLGTGCGAAGLGLALLCPAAVGIGLEKQPPLADAAGHNARLLALDRRFAVVGGDAADPRVLGRLAASGKFDVVLFNPPWRVEGSGRVPSDALRRSALFGSADALEIFAGAAARLLAPGGRCCAAIGAFRLRDQLDALSGAGLFPRRVCEVRSLPERGPWLCLIEAVREPAPECEAAELTLCERPGVLTEQAVAFCPFLQKTDTTVISCDSE